MLQQKSLACLYLYLYLDLLLCLSRRGMTYLGTVAAGYETERPLVSGYVSWMSLSINDSVQKYSHYS
jgi:hypothetical protein